MEFEFPNEDGDPFKSSGGKMEWNDELQKDIPQGWQVVELSKLLVENSQASRIFAGAYRPHRKL